VKLKLLSYNIRFGGVGREKALAELISSVSPDVVVFQEATRPMVIEELSRKTSMPYWAAKWDHSIGCISRIRIEHFEWLYPAGARHSFLEVVPADLGIRIFGLHLSARFSKWDERRRAREIKALLESIKRHQHGFHVVLGDFNTLAPGEIVELNRLPAWIRALVWISGRKLNRETIQVMLDNGYADGFRMLHETDKGYSFPTRDPHVRLDYLFLPSRYAASLVQCDVVQQPEHLVRAASDHCPLLAELKV
jgi:exodeoxyribonuclease-3